MRVEGSQAALGGHLTAPWLAGLANEQNNNCSGWNQALLNFGGLKMAGKGSFRVQYNGFRRGAASRLKESKGEEGFTSHTGKGWGKCPACSHSGRTPSSDTGLNPHSGANPCLAIPN